VRVYRCGRSSKECAQFHFTIPRHSGNISAPVSFFTPYTAGRIRGITEVWRRGGEKMDVVSEVGGRGPHNVATSGIVLLARLTKTISHYQHTYGPPTDRQTCRRHVQTNPSVDCDPHVHDTILLPRDALVQSAVLRRHVVCLSVCEVGGS